MTTSFWIHTYNLQPEQPVRSDSGENFDFTVHEWNNSSNHFFDWQQKYFGIKGNLYNQFFIIASTDSFTFPQQRHLQCFSFIEKSHNYVYLVMPLTQEEEHNQSTFSPNECRILSTFNPFRTFHRSLHESVAYKIKYILSFFLT